MIFKQSLIDFKEMPLVLKGLLIISLYSLLTTFTNFIQLKPITTEYFNSGFPKNYPLVWYLYYLAFDAVTIYVYFHRSYTILKKYLYVVIGILILSLANSVYFVINLTPDQKTPVIIVYVFTYIFAALIFLYLLKQKKYFNKK